MGGFHVTRVCNSGGKGKAKSLSEAKTDRSRRVNISGDYRTGINITNEVKLQFEHGINKYYRKTNNYSLKDVYHFILRDFLKKMVK